MTKSYDLPRYGDLIKHILSEVLDQIDRTDAEANEGSNPVLADYYTDLARRFTQLADDLDDRDAGRVRTLDEPAAMVQPHATTGNAIYAMPGLEQLTRADRWLYQLGNIWVAVAPWEDKADWFADALADGSELPMQTSYPIERIPTSGTLRWRDSDWTEREAPAFLARAELLRRMGLLNTL